jgi:hypothetical protein
VLCLVKNSKGAGALCCSIGEPKCFVSEHPEGHFRALGGNNRPLAWPCQVAMYLWFSFSSTPFYLYIQAGLILRDFFFARFCFNTVWHRRYVMFFSLTQFGIDDPWHHLCWRLAESDITVTP